MSGSGGLGAVSIGISEALVGLLIFAVVVVVVWKLVKLFLAALN
jgi:hypothetical protein